ncbi:MAG: DUF3592 domain-containing protein [Pseudomonadota bacterium]
MTDEDHYPARSAWSLFLRMGGWIVIPFTVALVILSLVGQLIFNTAERFEVEGREAVAVVEDKYVTERRDSDGDRTYTYYFVLDFVTQRREEMRVTKSVGSGFYRGTDVGGELPIRYLESDPETVEVQEGGYALGAAILRWVALLIGCIWLAGLWVTGRWTVEALRARKYGKVEEATVVEVVKTSVRVNNQPRFRIVWKDSAGREGRSMLRKAADVEGWHGRDAIRIYQGLKRSWWARDIGDR